MKTNLKEYFRRPEVIFSLVMAVVLLGLLITALALREWVREAILLPLMKIIYYIQLVGGSVPQSLFWLAVLISGSYLAIRSFRRVKEPEASATDSSFEREPGRVHHLADMIRESLREGYIRRNLADRFTAVAREAQTSQADLDSDEAFLNLPPDLSQRSLHHLKESELAERSALSREVNELLEREAPAIRSGWKRGSAYFRSRLRKLSRKKIKDEGFVQIDAMIRSLEERMK